MADDSQHPQPSPQNTNPLKFSTFWYTINTASWLEQYYCHFKRMLWCKYCDVEGHSVVQYQALHEELTNFDAAIQMAQGPASDPKRDYPITHWGQGRQKNVHQPGAFLATRGVPVQGINYLKTPPLFSTPSTLRFDRYVYQQRAYWLWCNLAWTHQNLAEGNPTL
ncbi:hypothetical protein Pdw03_2992 [Penicillium digitatum]|uniref:Uncharacterized protein n=1 Tax=Penicillium digitatum TaxID=36651 RepID=A0A7T6XFE3_PENDI|nr:hypothetical protein Pdw03_2992 [Penicillium digitatum]